MNLIEEIMKVKNNKNKMPSESEMIEKSLKSTTTFQKKKVFAKHFIDYNAYHQLENSNVIKLPPKSENQDTRSRQDEPIFYVQGVNRAHSVNPFKRSNVTHCDEKALQDEIASLKKTHKISIDISKLSTEIFEKKRCLKPPNEQLPVPKEFFNDGPWEIEGLKFRKSALDLTKSLLDDYDLGPWHMHTRRINTAGEVVQSVRRQANPDYCSQAWCKFYECLGNYPVIPKILTDAANQPHCYVPFRSVHLCEAPGAFVSATNHFILNNHPQLQWDWLATTLSPYHEGNDVGSMINEDKLILTSLNNWTFLEDTTGNIMNLSNVESLIRQVKQKFTDKNDKAMHVNLVTADGSIDCQNKPLDQEATVVPLHFAEIVTALHILSVGGSFVLKIFTFCECKTIGHLYLLSSMFKEVHLFKPATSKEGNSEVYVICLSYLGSDKFSNELQKLKTFIGEDPKRPILSRDFITRKGFYERLVEAAEFFTGHQIIIIERNVNSYTDFEKTKDNPYLYTDLIRKEVAQSWLEKHDVSPLPAHQRLYNLKIHRNDAKTHVDAREESESFTEKSAKRGAGIWKRLLNIQTQMQHYSSTEKASWYRSEIKGGCSQFVYLKGKPYENILSSRFCYGKLLLERQDLRTVAERYVNVLNPQPTEFQCGKCDLQNLREKFKTVLSDVNTDPENWQAITLCFRETMYDLFMCSDRENTHRSLKSVLSELTNMKRGQNMFLCRFPLLTRLHLGFIYVLSTMFKKAIICMGGTDSPTHPKGILLYQFSGFQNTDLVSVVGELARVVVDIGDSQKKEVILSIIPIEILVRMKNYNEIFQYNLFNTAINVDEIIEETREKLLELKRLDASGELNMEIMDDESQE